MVSRFVLLLQYINEMPVLNANCKDPDQTTRSVVSDQGLHRLPMSLYGTLGINGLPFPYVRKTA